MHNFSFFESESVVILSAATEGSDAVRRDFNFSTCSIAFSWSTPQYPRSASASLITDD